MSEELDLSNGVKRPVFLKVISVLSFVYLGFQSIKLFLGLIEGKLNSDELIEKKVQLTKIFRMFDDGSEQVTESIRTTGLILEQTNDSYWLVQILTLIIVAIGVSSVMKMFNGYRIGFHFYIIYSLISVGSIYLYLSPNLVSMPSLLMDVLISGLFIFMYSRNLHWMK
ncbi:MAG: hypothetical protein KC454_07495 [Flavobacteriales bacterium]|nr:hypothetical protein [Flavobacteriales bacterium]